MKVLATVASAIALAFVGLVAFGSWANDQAARRARTFCDSVRPGMDEVAVVESGRAVASRHMAGAQAHRFIFQGWVFNASLCVVQVAAGRVVGVAVEDAQD